MSQYRRKPTPVIAEVYHKGLEDGVVGCGHCPSAKWNAGEDDCTQCDSAHPFIYAPTQVPDGRIYIKRGDYIVTQSDGTKLVRSPALFDKEFEPLNADESAEKATAMKEPDLPCDVGDTILVRDYWAVAEYQVTRYVKTIFINLTFTAQLTKTICGEAEKEITFGLCDIGKFIFPKKRGDLPAEMTPLKL